MKRNARVGADCVTAFCPACKLLDIPCRPTPSQVVGLYSFLDQFAGLRSHAITAAICSGREAHPDPRKRYVAGVALGIFYIIAGVFGATLAGLFAALPKEMVATLAGLALLSAIANGLTAAMAEEKTRESALFTFLLTDSGVSILGLGSAFWGLIAGLTANLFWTTQIKKPSPKILPN